MRDNQYNEPIMVFSNNAICLRGSLIIYFDPFQIPKKMNDADFIFITHPHWDHFSLIDILKVKNDHTNFIVPKEILEELLDIGILEEHIKVVKPNEEYFFSQMSFKTVSSYNREKEYHQKERQWLGYVLNMDQIIYYIAGDTDNLVENQKIKADVIFLPVGGLYTMDAREAARLANTIRPHLAIPTHYLSVVGSLLDAQNFKRYLDKDIACKIFYKEKALEED